MVATLTKELADSYIEDYSYAMLYTYICSKYNVVRR